MNQDVSQQVQLLLNIDAVSPNDSITIMSVCSQVLNSAAYITTLTNTLNPVFMDPTFDLVSEIAQVLLALIKMAAICTYSQNIPSSQLKYVLWSSLYYYLVNNQPDLLRKIDLGSIRLAFSNAFELIIVPIENVQIVAKTVCDSCLSCLGWSKKTHI